MIEIETALATVLLAEPAISALVADRVGPMPLEQLAGTTPQVPAITYARISSVAPVCLRGEKTQATLRVQLDCWAKSIADVRNLARAVRARLNGYSGTVDGVALEAVFLRAGGGDQYEPDTKLRRVQMDFSVTCKEGDA